MGRGCSSGSGRRCIGDTEAAAALFAPTFADVTNEALRVAYLDGDFGLLRLSAMPEGRAHQIDLCFRALIGEALDIGARALIVAHNHPSGDPTPSRADKIATRRLVDIVRSLEMRVVDHLIFAGDTIASFRALGLI